MLEIKKGIELQGRYVISDQLGSGGFAIVWRATDKQLGRDVAIKRLLRLDKPQADRLMDEARRTVKLGGHQNIVQVYDVIQEGEEALLVMEYVDGETLEELCQRCIREKKWLEQEESIDYFKQVLQGLVFAHQQNLSHRDVKPSNILVSKLGLVKLVDFGLAKTIEELQKAPMELGFAWSGTPNFMSPEQANGEPLDQQTDIFSAGIVGYILLTGKHPFNHPSAVSSVFDLIKEPSFECDYPNHANGIPIPESICKVLARMLHKNKAKRYQSVIDALTDLSKEPAQLCSNCGAANSLSSRFCGQCGNELKQTQAGDQTKKISPQILAATQIIEQPTAEELTEEGFLLTQDGQWSEAIRKYQEAIKRDPKFGRAYTNLGYALNRVGQYADAIEILSRAASLTSEDAHLHRIFDQRGVSKLNLNDFEGAIADFSEALSYYQFDARIYMHRAQAYAQIVDNEKALQDISRALRLDPDNHRAIRLKRSLETQ